MRFQYQTLLVAATSTQGDYVAWSTFPHLNNMLGANLRIPAVSVRDSPVTSNVHQCLHGCACIYIIITWDVADAEVWLIVQWIWETCLTVCLGEHTLQVREEDQNQDGKLDLLVFQLQLPLKPEEQVYSVQLLLTFSYQLFVCIPLQCRVCLSTHSIHLRCRCFWCLCHY